MNSFPITFSNAEELPLTLNDAEASLKTYNGLWNQSDNIAVAYIKPVRNLDSDSPFLILMQAGQFLPIKVRFARANTIVGTGKVYGIL